MPRSASNYLYNILVQNFPDHYNEKYILESYFDSNKINDLIQKYSQKKDVILKIHARNMFDYSGNLLTDYFLNKEWHKIILMRKNLFNATLSLSVAKMSNEIVERKVRNNFNITISTKFFISCLENHLKDLNAFSYLKENFLINNVVYYEDLTFIQTQDISTLGLPINVENNIKQKKYSPRNVNNIDELKNIFFKRIKKFNNPYYKIDNGNFVLL